MIQIGDCNAPATDQALMNHLFKPREYIGVWINVYLASDDVAIYSDTLDQYFEHIMRIVVNILVRERLFLSGKNLQFQLAQSCAISDLGRVMTDRPVLR